MDTTEDIIESNTNVEAEKLLSNGKTLSDFDDDDSNEGRYSSESDDDLDDIGEFSFETSRLAYKTNPDYRSLVECIVILKAQRAQALHDKKLLIEHQEKALADPLEFVEKLKRKEDLGLPKRQEIPRIPKIDWSKYDITGHKSSFERRQLKRLASTDSAPRPKRRHTESEEDKDDYSAGISTFNKPWSEEEKEKLEDLLLQFPPEEVETRRWEKISSAMGTRTVTQVASHVQKYFLKLSKVGLPVPGREPNKQRKKSLVNSNIGKNQKQMNGDSSIEGVSDEDDINPELRTTPEYKELLFIKKVLKKRH